jgi:hypothetical protein
VSAGKVTARVARKLRKIFKTKHTLALGMVLAAPGHGSILAKEAFEILEFWGIPIPPEKPKESPNTRWTVFYSESGREALDMFDKVKRRLKNEGLLPKLCQPPQEK